MRPGDFAACLLLFFVTLGACAVAGLAPWLTAVLSVAVFVGVFRLLLRCNRRCSQ